METKSPSSRLSAEDEAVTLSDSPLSLDEAVRRVAGPERGALITFSGCVRETEQGAVIRAIAYESYVAMARQQLGAIAAEARRRFGVALSIHHRLGRVAVGETSLIVACAAPHRAEAFDGLRFVVERIKSEAAIWKVDFEHVP
jgi:molybdopterin synthase catalytic subunit